MEELANNKREWEAQEKKEMDSKDTKKRNMTRALICEFALLLLFSVGGVYAYIQDVSGLTRNVFSSEKLEIRLEESDTGLDGDGDLCTNTYIMKPGADIDKDPIATVSGDSTDCYLYVKLEKSDNFDDYLTYDIADGWTELEGNPGIYWRAVSHSADDQPFDVLKDDRGGDHHGKVNLKSGISESDLKDIDTPPVLKVTAYAVQQATYDSPLAAWNSATWNSTSGSASE